MSTSWTNLLPVDLRLYLHVDVHVIEQHEPVTVHIRRHATVLCNRPAHHADEERGKRQRVTRGSVATQPLARVVTSNSTSPWTMCFRDPALRMS